MSEEIDEEEIERLVDEIGEGSLVSLLGISGERFLSLIFVYAVTSIGGAAVYGVIAVLHNMLNFFRVFSGGPITAAERTISRLEKAEQNGILLVAGGISTAFNLLVGGLIIYFEDLIVANTVISGSQPTILWLFSLSLMLNAVLMVATVYMKATRKIRIFNFFTKFTGPLFFLVFAAVALLFSSSASSVWTGVTAAIAFNSLLALAAIHRWNGFSVTDIELDRSTLERYLSYTGSSTITNIKSAVQLSGFTFFMAVFLTPVEAGVMGAGLAIGILSKYVLFSVNQIFPPIASKLYGEGKLDEIGSLYRTTSKLITLFSVPIATVTIIYHREIMSIFSAAYVPEAHVLAILALGNFMASVFGSVGYLLLMTDNERESAVLQTVLTAASLVINYFPTIRFGLTGLAAAYTLVYLLNNIMETVTLNYLEGLQPFTKDHLAFIGAGAFIAGSSMTLKSFTSLYISAITTGLMIAVYLRLSRRLLEDSEVSMIRRLGEKFSFQSVW